MKYNALRYQDFATRHIWKNAGAGLMLEMGLGKTVATLTAIAELIRTGEVKRVLVIAPKKVAASVWPAEVEKWDHLRHLKVSLVLGDAQKRKNALLAKVNVYVINRENATWLVSHYASSFPFDMVVVDESSSFKNPKSARFRALRMVMPKVKRTVILTGTPTPQSYLDLWAQVYLIDRGKRLGEKYTAYRDRFFKPGARNGRIIFDYELKTDKQDAAEILGADINEKVIFEKVSDICVSMKTRDYLDLPPRVDRNVEVILPPDILRQYKDFERSRVLELAETGQQITALNSSAIAMKLMQFSNGAVYGDDGGYTVVHNEKLETLAELVEVATSPVLIFYSYRHDLERLQAFLKPYKPVLLKGSGEIDSWNLGKIRTLLAHPASAGHGLNLQAGGHNVLWYGVPVPRSLELYQQGIARLDRMGQTRSVINQRLITRGTMDQLAFDGLDEKADMQELFMRATRAIMENL